MGEVVEAFDEFCMGFSIDFVGGAFFRLDGSDVVEPSHERIASDESRINGDECEQWHAFGVIGIAERPSFDAIVEFELFEHDFIEQVVAPESAWTVRTRHEKDDFFVGIGVLHVFQEGSERDESGEALFARRMSAPYLERFSGWAR